MAQLSKHKRAAVEAVESERELSLVISQLEEFSARIAHGLGELDWLGRRGIIHTLVAGSKSTTRTSRLSFGSRRPREHPRPGRKGPRRA
jgi:hypothetical protein